jgi:hypothetical protein
MATRDFIYETWCKFARERGGVDECWFTDEGKAEFMKRRKDPINGLRNFSDVYIEIVLAQHQKLDDALMAAIEMRATADKDAAAQADLERQQEGSLSQRQKAHNQKRHQENQRKPKQTDPTPWRRNFSFRRSRPLSNTFDFPSAEKGQPPKVRETPTANRNRCTACGQFEDGCRCSK